MGTGTEAATKVAAKQMVKKNKKAPSLRARKAFANALENGGNMSKAMRDAGFSDALAKNPQKLTRSEAWQALVDEHISESTIVKKHKQLLETKRLHQMMIDPGISDAEIRDVIKKVGGVMLRASIVDVEFVNKKGELITYQKKNVFYSMPDGMIQDKALDKLYKLKGLYAKDGSMVNVQVNNQLASNTIVFENFHEADSQ